jgi:hypothetical protein
MFFPQVPVLEAFLKFCFDDLLKKRLMNIEILFIEVPLGEG